jgi:hypothetical protein
LVSVVFLVYRWHWFFVDARSLFDSLSLSLSFGPKEWLLLLSDCILLWFGSLSRSLAAGSYVWKTENRKQKTGEKKHASLSLARALAKLQRKMARVPLIF